MTGKEFTIESAPEYKFRLVRIPPTELIAISRQIDFEKFNQTLALCNYALEHIEVVVDDKWQPVKISGRDVYNPFGIDNNIVLLNNLVNYFIEEVIYNTFIKSSE